MKTDRLIGRAAALYREYLLANRRKTSHVFAALMVGQWVFAIAIALLWSPYGWAGKVQALHVHVWTAVLLGGALCSLPLYLTLRHPEAEATPFVVAAAQMLWSALLIHLSGGRIETHFHVFGSLAFVAFYRDWRVLIPATVTVAGEHLLRGILWPESVYGIVNPEWWRFAEHAFWVVFEDIVLTLACLRGVAELQLVARRQAEAEDSVQRVTELNQTLDSRVDERTCQLSEANGQLKDSLDRLGETQRQLVDASRSAGMAEVATAVLHNVGNVLNSINVSSDQVSHAVTNSKASSLADLSSLLVQEDMAGLLKDHPKGKHLPAYVTHLASALKQEQDSVLKEMGSLQRNIEHIKVIVQMQQAHARGVNGALETVSLTDLVEEVVTMSAAAHEKCGVKVEQELAKVPPSLIDRHRVLQILVNLFSNSKQAIQEKGDGRGTIFISLRQHGGQVKIELKDDGCGIAPEHMPRMFNHGFTTKKEGHGFGLHGAANAAKEMGGSLSCKSEGWGRGATFTLELPVRTPAAVPLSRAA
jgi:signal transduction histidine kinase